MSGYGLRDTNYQGASLTDRATEGWLPTDQDAHSTMVEELKPIRERSRDLDRNEGLAGGIRNTKRDNVIGAQLILQPIPNYQVLGQTREWARDWARTTKAHFNDYAESRYFDQEGENNFPMHSHLMYDSQFLSGSGCAVPYWLERPGTPYRTCFKIIEVDRLSNPQGKPDTPTLADGIERTRDGVVTGYHVQNFHPGDDTASAELPAWELIPAFHNNGRRGFIHTYTKERPGQTRGKSAASAVLGIFGMAGKYKLSEVQSMAMNAKVAGFMESNLPAEQVVEIFGGKIDDYDEYRRKFNGQITPGSILQTPIGSTYRSHIPGRNSSAYVGFMEWVFREIGASFNLPFELATRNFSKTNYSSARAALLEAWRSFVVERARFAFQWASPVYELWLEEAIAIGVIEAPDFYKYRGAYCRARWLAPGQHPIDRPKHETANEKGLKNDTLTYEQIYAEQGLDWEEQLEQRAIEKAYKQELNEKYKLKPESVDDPTGGDDPDDPSDPDDPDPDDPDGGKTGEQQAEERDESNSDEGDEE